MLGKYNKGRGAVYDWCRETVFYTGQTKQCQCCVLCVCEYIFMGKLFIVCGGLGSFPFIRMVNNKTIVLHLTRTYSCFVFCLVFFISLWFFVIVIVVVTRVYVYDRINCTRYNDIRCNYVYQRHSVNLHDIVL